MAYSQIEQRYLNALAEAYFPTMAPEDIAADQQSMDGMQLAAGPTDTRTDAGPSSKKVPYRPVPMKDQLTNPLLALSDIFAGAARSGTAQVIGSGGDLQSIKNGVTAIFNRPKDQGWIDAFIKGLEQKTSMVTSEQVRKDGFRIPFTDINVKLPPAIPEGAKYEKDRQYFAEIGEPVGEFAPLPGVIEAGVAGIKYGAKAAKALAPTAGKMAEDYMRKTGALMDVAPVGPASQNTGGLVFSTKDIETRLRLKQQRNEALAKGKTLPGEPKNDRIVIPAQEGSNLPDFVVGKLTVDDWKNRIESLLKPEQIDEYSRWYSEIKDTFMKYTGGDEQKVDRYMRAWLVANQNTSVDSAMANALSQAEQFARNIPENEMISGGLPNPTEAARRALKNEPITSGVGAKIADFVDSAENKGTRAFYGNDAQAGQPFVVDIHTARDTGLVDPILLNHLERLGYKVDKDAVKVDFKEGPTDTQYENRADFGRMLTQSLNDTAWQGRNDWKPHEVQAIGWMAMTRLTADAADNTTSALERNFRRITMELAPGEGSPWAKKFGEKFAALPVERQYQVTQNVTNRAVDMARSITGVDLRGLVHGTGGWENFQNPSAVAQTLATRHGAEYTANVLGYLLQQTEVWVNSVKGTTQNPKALAIDFIESGSDNLSTNDGLRKFWEKVMAADPTGLFVGYHPIKTTDGEVGIRVLIDKGGAARMQSVKDALADGGQINIMVTELDFTVRARGYEAELVKARNDWKESKDGQAYLGRLADLSRGRAPTNFDSLRKELENLFEQELAGGQATSRGKAGNANSAKPGKVTESSRTPPKGAK